MAATAETVNSSGEKENIHPQPISEKLKIILENSSQEGDFTSLKKEFCKAYDGLPKEEFQNSFKVLLMTAFCKTGQVVEINRLFGFISECAIKLDQDQRNNVDPNSVTVSPGMHHFLVELFQLLNMWSKANSSVVRSHAHCMLCVLLNKMQELGLEDVDVAVFEKIAEAVQRGRKDICASVRANAVTLAKFIQDPTIEDDVIISGLCWQLESDPSFKVRQNILEIIAACEETVLPVLERFLYDKNEHVRNAGLLYIADKISPQSFRKDQRCLILHHCMFDDSKLVRKSAENRLIPVWFRAYGDQLSCFLTELRLKEQHFEDLRFLKKLLTILISSMTLNQIMEDVGLDKETFVPTSTVTAEKAFIWRTFSEIAAQDKKYGKYLPSAENYTTYVAKYFKELSDEDDPYVCHELIKLQIYFQTKFSDENWPDVVGTVFDLVRNPFVSKVAIPVAVKYLKDFAPQDETSVQEQLMKTVTAFKMLYQAVPKEQKPQVMLKCITIISEMLNNDVVVWINDDIKSVKEDIILPLVQSEQREVCEEAIRALTLYCLLDAREAKQAWDVLSQSVSQENRCCSLRSIFDVFLHYGPEYFDHKFDNYETVYEETVNKMIQSAVKGHVEEQLVVADGTFKLYLSERLRSAQPLALVLLLTLRPRAPQTLAIRCSLFLTLYNKLKLDVRLLEKAFLEVVERLFQCSKPSPFFKIEIKSTTFMLLEFAKACSKPKEFSVESGEFMDALCILLTRHFLGCPGRLAAEDLQLILSDVHLTSNHSGKELRKNINLIIKQLEQPSAGKKKSFHTKKFFFNFLKKIPPSPVAQEISADEITVSETQSDDDSLNFQLPTQRFRIQSTAKKLSGSTAKKRTGEDRVEIEPLSSTPFAKRGSDKSLDSRVKGTPAASRVENLSPTTRNQNQSAMSQVAQKSVRFQAGNLSRDEGHSETLKVQNESAASEKLFATPLPKKRSATPRVRSKLTRSRAKSQPTTSCIDNQSDASLIENTPSPPKSAPPQVATPVTLRSATPRVGTSATPRVATSATPRVAKSATPRATKSVTPRVTKESTAIHAENQSVSSHTKKQSVLSRVETRSAASKTLRRTRNQSEVDPGELCPGQPDSSPITIEPASSQASQES